MVVKRETDGRGRIFFKRILFSEVANYLIASKLVPVSRQLSKKITCYVRRSYPLRRSWRCVLQRWNLICNASCLMDDCKADGRSVHRLGIRMRHAKRQAASSESRSRTARQAPYPRGRVKRRSAVPGSLPG